MTDAQPTKEKLPSDEWPSAAASDAHWLAVFAMMQRHALELQCLAYMRENLELRRDVARYDNGRVVLLAELDTAKRLAIKYMAEIKKLQRSKP